VLFDAATTDDAPFPLESEVDHRVGAGDTG